MKPCKAEKRWIVITIHADLSAIARIFQTEDAAMCYRDCCRFSRAQQIIFGSNRLPYTLDTLADAVADTYDLPRSGVRAAYGLTPV